jgi:hypothetical protein
MQMSLLQIFANRVASLKRCGSREQRRPDNEEHGGGQPMVSEESRWIRSTRAEWYTAYAADIASAETATWKSMPLAPPVCLPPTARSNRQDVHANASVSGKLKVPRPKRTNST